MRIAVFASGGGSNFQALIDRHKSGELPVEFAFLLVNNSGCGAVQRAIDADIEVLHMSGKTHADPEEYSKALLVTLAEHQVDLIVLAGYMKKLPDVVIETFKNRILNIHPSLLPAFGGPGMYGPKVHEAVVARGVRFSGMTIHLVNENYDEGPILFQDSVPVRPEMRPEEVAAAVLKKEHENYWQVVKAFAEGRVNHEGKLWWIN